MKQLPVHQHITYQLQHRKCGKAACSTCRKSQGHGPYWYAYWREGSRLRSGYIGKINPSLSHDLQATLALHITSNTVVAASSSNTHSHIKEAVLA